MPAVNPPETFVPALPDRYLVITRHGSERPEKPVPIEGWAKPNGSPWSPVIWDHVAKNLVVVVAGEDQVSNATVQFTNEVRGQTYVPTRIR